MSYTLIEIGLWRGSQSGLECTAFDEYCCRRPWRINQVPFTPMIAAAPDFVLTTSHQDIFAPSLKDQSMQTFPFRADVVGSLLRPAKLKAARADRDAGKITAAQLASVEDDEIRRCLGKQADCGLEVATDGEFRRSWWHYDFFGQLDGVEIRNQGAHIQFKGVATTARELHVTGKIGFPASHPMLGHFKFLKANTHAAAKMTIPSPTVMHFRLEPHAVAASAYPSRDALFDDLASTYRAAVAAFYAAGCRYLQFDDTVWAYLCSEDQRQQAKARGLDVTRLAQAYGDLINACLRDKPADMTITTHVCRGNFRSTWISEGGYEPVAELMLGHLNYDGYFLEYDSDRAGGFEPLRFLPKGKKRVVVGLVTSKSGALENAADIRARLSEAAKFAPLDQLCLSPQCGFASTEDGNALSEDEQWAKLKFVTTLARDIWK
jgi:5-methyltetrahydropteroyltriglutamate--homocysteine methyltransferase